MLVSDDQNWWRRYRFARDVVALGADPSAVDFRRREGRVVAWGKRFKMVR